MNYGCAPDLDPSKPLTVDAVMLFQRFPQDQDMVLVEEMLEREIGRHRAACEFAILHHARAGIYWVDLPPHSIDTVELAVCDDLKKAGFLVEFQQTAHSTTIREGDKETVVPYLNSRFTAKWFRAPALDQGRISAEWQRRLALENEAIAAHPPGRLSRGLGPALDTGGAVWASTVDASFVAEVQHHRARAFLCIFRASGELLHMERTSGRVGRCSGRMSETFPNGSDAPLKSLTVGLAKCQSGRPSTWKIPAQHSGRFAAN